MAGTNETCIANMIIKSDLLCVGGAGRTKRSAGLHDSCTCPVNASKDAHEMTFTPIENTSLHL